MRIMLIFIVLVYSCKKEKNNQQKILTKNNFVTIIFNKNLDSIKSLNLNPSKVKFSYYNDFKSQFIKFNKKEIDTVNIPILSDKLYLSHSYGIGGKYIYEFNKGDTVEFSYKKGIPTAHVLNRNTLKYDINFELMNGLKKPLEPHLFFQKHKRHPTNLENKSSRKNFITFQSKTNKFLDSIFKKNLISKSLYSLHKSRNKFYHYNIGVKNNDSLINEKSLHLGAYKYYLEKFTLNKYNKKMKINRIDVIFDSILQSKSYSKENKQFLLNKYINVMGEKFGGIKFKNQFLKYSNYTKDTSLVNEIKNKYLINFSDLYDENDSTYFITKDKQKKNLSEILNNNKGKLIYIDFWASWCAPCRKVMPKSIELRKEYLNKDIIFIYISIDKEFSNWQKASKEENILTYQNNILAINYPNADYYKNLNLSTIPRYLLYNKNGKLVDKNALGPESKELRILFNKLLKE